MWYRQQRWRQRLAVEVAVMKSRFPGFQLWSSTGNQLLWIGVLQPVPESSFLVVLEYPEDYPYRALSLWVLEPELVPGAGHVYGDGSCCIHSDSWNPDRGTAAGCVPLLAGWLVAYLNWQRTGEAY